MSTETSPLTDAQTYPQPGAPMWLELTTEDPEAVQNFYRGVFGWRFSEPDADLGGYISIKAGGTSVGGLMSSVGMQCPEGQDSGHVRKPDVMFALVQRLVLIW